MAALPDGPVKKSVRQRLLTDMLTAVRDSSGVSGGWKVLVMDEVATKVMSSALKMSDITDAGGQGKQECGQGVSRCGWACKNVGRWESDAGGPA